MKGENDILNELRAMDSPLVDIPKAMPYELPIGYFESFAANLKLVKAGKGMPFQLPEGYFESFETELFIQLSKSSAEFRQDVPVGYFEKFPSVMLAKVKATEPARKVIPFGKVKMLWKNVRWAAAAVLLVGLGFGVYRTYIYKPEFDVHNALAMVEQDAITEYIHLNIDEFELEIISNNAGPFDIRPSAGELSNEEIENYINESGIDESVLN